MAQLEKPSHLFFNGEIVEWETAKIHVWSETAIRGTNVFEGLRAYWIGSKNEWRIAGLQEHMDRLKQSARMLRIPHTFEPEYLQNAIFELLRKLGGQGDYYVRPTLFIEEGAYAAQPDEIQHGVYVVAFPQTRQSEPRPCEYLVSSYRRISSDAISPKIKTGSAYLNFRLPRIEAAERGYQDAILLNDQGMVCETGGAALFLVLDGKLITPSLDQGLLDSITRRRVIKVLAKRLKIEVLERAVAQEELYGADEIMACGTLLEIARVIRVDEVELMPAQPDGILNRLFAEYQSDVTAEVPDPDWLTCVSQT